MRSGEQSGRPCENELWEKERKKERNEEQNSNIRRTGHSICGEFDITSGVILCYDLAIGPRESKEI